MGRFLPQAGAAGYRRTQVRVVAVVRRKSVTSTIFDRLMSQPAQHDPSRDAAAAEFIPLARAAALVHDRLFPDQAVKESKTLDVIALALSALIPLTSATWKAARNSPAPLRNWETMRWSRRASA